MGLYKEFESACQESERCMKLSDDAVHFHKKNCILECIAPTCYKILYEDNPLEAGEVDVREESFKGCFVQRSGLSRN